MTTSATLFQVDNQLRPGRVAGAWEADTGPMRVNISGYRHGRPTIVVWQPSPDGGRPTAVTQVLQSALWRMRDGSSVPIAESQATEEASSDQPGQLRFANPIPGVDDLWELQGDCLKHWWVIDHLVPPTGASHLDLQLLVTPAECAPAESVGTTTGAIPLFSVRQAEPLFVLARGEAAADDGSTRTHTTYEWQTDARGRLALSVLVDSLWIRDLPDGVSFRVDPTVISGASVTNTWPNQRKVVRFPSNGVVLALVSDGTNLLARYSDDGGVSWKTPAIGATVGAYTEGHVVLDQLEQLHINVTASSVASRLIGTPDASRTGYTWSAKNQIAVSPAHAANCVVHREGTTTYEHAVVSYESGTYYPYYQRFDLPDGGAVTAQTAIKLNTTAYTAATRPVITRDLTGNLYPAWSTGATGAGKGVRAVRMAYAAGPTWTQGAEEAVIETVYAVTMGAPVCDSQGRPVLVFKDNAGNLRVFRRSTGAVGVWTDLSPTPAQAGSDPVLVIDQTDALYLLLTNSGLFYRRLSNGGTATDWGAAVTMDSDTSVTAPSARADTVGNAMDVTYRAGSNIKSLRVPINQVPLTPDGLTPNGTGVDGAQPVTLSATAHDSAGDYPAGAEWELMANGASTSYYLSAAGTLAPTTADQWIAQSGTSMTVTAQVEPGQLANGKAWQHRTRTVDAGGLVSPWSAWTPFKTQASPTADIAVPAPGSAVATTTVTVTATYAQANGAALGSMAYRLYADNAGARGALLETQTATGLQRSLTTDLTPYNGGYVWLEVQATTVDGVTGTATVRQYAVSFTPPATPIPAATPAIAAHPPRIVLTHSNPTPAGTQPGVVRMDWERTADGVTWSAVGSCDPGATVYDLLAAAGQVYAYRVWAVGENSTKTKSETVTARLTFPVPWLVNLTEPSLSVALPLTNAEWPLTYPQSITDTETLGAARKKRSSGNVLGAEGELVIMANHRDPRTFDLAERIRTAKQLAITWLLKMPQIPGPLMTSIPGRMFEVSLGQMQEIPGPSKTVLRIPIVEVGDPVG